LHRSEVINHPQIVANEVLMENEHPEAGPLRQARGAALFSATPPTQRYGAPLLGQHTLEELKKIGLSDADLEKFITDGVVAVPLGEQHS